MIKFTKMQGIGNDYVYIDGTNENIENPAELSKIVSDRHFGIGSDGLILILKSDVADFKMRIFNPDGTEAEMCGNGVRCVGKFVYDKGLTTKTNIEIETLGGIKKLTLNVKEGKVDTVEVDMGVPMLNADEIPVTFYDNVVSKNDNNYIQVDKDIDGEKIMMTCVSVGNPHAVSFLDNIDNLNIEKYGPAIENDKRFPNKINAEFVEVIDRQTIKMRVWERSVGETMACGTGSCASVCAAILNEYTDREVKVLLLGGTLNIKWDRKDNHIYMTGPAVTVFEGEFDY